jgi:hypothetical protein
VPRDDPQHRREESEDIVSLADELSPAPEPATRNPTPSRGNAASDGFFERVNEIPILDVISWLGLETSEKSGRTIVKCPGCGAFDDTSSAVVGNAVKCLHQTCSTAGPASAPGLRNVIGLVMAVRGRNPDNSEQVFESAKEAAERFGVPVPQRTPERARRRDSVPEDPEAEAPVPVVVIREDELLGEACKRAVSQQPKRVCTTGHAKLDEMTGGFLPGWCWVVGAPTNWGKTSWAIAVADSNLRAGRGVLIVSLEDAPELYGDRLLLRRARRSTNERIDADHLRARRLTYEEMALAELVRKEAQPRPMLLDARGMKGERIASDLKRILDDNAAVDLVIIDYLGEVRSARTHQDRRNEVSEMAALIRGVVKPRNRALIMLSQITIGDDPDKFPRMNQIRESRDVVNAAEVVAMCGIQQTDLKSKRDGTVKVRAGERAMMLEKVKQGRKGIVELVWDDEAACFCDVADTRYSETDPRDPPIGRSWSPGAPAPHPYHEPVERDEDPGAGMFDDMLRR